MANFTVNSVVTNLQVYQFYHPFLAQKVRQKSINQ